MARSSAIRDASCGPSHYHRAWQLSRYPRELYTRRTLSQRSPLSLSRRFISLESFAAGSERSRSYAIPFDKRRAAGLPEPRNVSDASTLCRDTIAIRLSGNLITVLSAFHSSDGRRNVYLCYYDNCDNQRASLFESFRFYPAWIVDLSPLFDARNVIRFQLICLRDYLEMHAETAKSRSVRRPNSFSKIRAMITSVAR